MSDILNKILQRKHEEVAQAKSALPLEELIHAVHQSDNPARNFTAAIRAKLKGNQPAIIAEIKKASPSQGVIRADFDPAADQYFGQPFWTPDGKTLLLQWMNRTQNRLKLYAVDPETGKGDVIYTEEQETWLGWIETPHFTKTGFLMVRDFEKWQHIYLYAYKEKTTTRL